MSNILFFSGGDYRGFSRALVSGLVLSNEVTFARSTTGTYFDNSGVLQTAAIDVARFHYLQDGSGLSGFLVEEARTNNALYNRDFTNAAWTASNITPLKDATGIDNASNSASTLTASAGNGTIEQTITIASAEFTTSFFVKRKTGVGTIEITDDGGSNYTDITGSINSSTFTKVEITRTQANPTIGFRIVTSGDEIEVDFAQLEEGDASSTPIATTTVAANRAADIATVDLTTSPWFSSTAGTVFVDCVPLGIKASQHLFSADDGTTDNTIVMRHGSGTITDVLPEVIDATVSQQTATAGTAANGTRYTAVNAWEEDNFGFSFDGGTASTDNSGTIPTGLTTLRIGASVSGNYFNGIITSFNYYAYRQTDAAIESM